MSAHENFTLEWLRKADNDLKTARLVLAAEDGPPDTTCFHSQQVVEKGLKALLTHRSIHFSKTHSLHLLLDLLAIPELEKFRKSCIILSGYAVEARYPGDYDEPDREEAEQAVNMASEIYDEILLHMKSEESP